MGGEVKKLLCLLSLLVAVGCNDESTNMQSCMKLCGAVGVKSYNSESLRYAVTCVCREPTSKDGGSRP